MADRDEILNGHCIDHPVNCMKIEQLCQWKKGHIDDHKENDKMLSKFKKEIDDKFGGQKNWVIGILVTLALNLVGISIGLVIMLVRLPNH